MYSKYQDSFFVVCYIKDKKSIRILCGASMQYMFRNFNRSYFEKVNEFLIALSMDNHTHINWNWARWEWMFFHPEFDKNSLDKIGLWFSMKI